METNIEQYLEDFQDSEELRCLPSPDSIYIKGLANEQLIEMQEAVLDNCSLKPLDFSNNVTKLHIDSSGAVTDITSRNSSDEIIMVLDCMKSALNGLQFSCLAEADICVYASILMIE